MPTPYNGDGSAPYARDSDTSAAAAGSIDGPALRRLVRHAILKAGRRGLTCDEVEVLLDMRHQTASARIRELALRGAVHDSTVRRRTRSNRSAIVWVVPS